MRILKVFLLVLFLSILSFAQPSEALQFKARIGFIETGERIIAQKFFADDNKLVLIGRKSIQLWDVENAKLIAARPHDIPNLDKAGISVVISPDAQKAIVLDSFSWRIIRKEKKVSATVWDLQTGKQIAVLERPTESIRDAEWSENGATLITYSGIFNDKRTEVSFWDGASLTFRNSILLMGNLLLRQLSRDGERLFTSVEKSGVTFLGGYKSEGKATVWNAQHGKVEQNLTFGAGKNSFGFSLFKSVSPNERYFAANAPGKISVWEIGGSDLPKYEIRAAKKDSEILFYGFSDDGKYLIAYQYQAYQYKNRTLEFYDAANGEFRFSPPNTKSYENVKLLADGKTLVLQNCERADVFNLTTRQKLYDLKLVCKSDFDYVSTSYRDFDILRFHPNGRFLLTFSDKTVRVWNAENGALAQTMVDPNRAENKRKDKNKDDGLSWSAGWLRDGKYLFASGADEKSILLWEMK